MKKEDIDAFIEIITEVGYDWTPERVEEEYGDLTLQEALRKHFSRIPTFYDFVEEVVKPDAQRLGLWKKDQK